DRGSVIHDALARFAQEWERLAPQERLPRLLEIGRAAFEPIATFPDVAALWWPRCERLARHVVAYEMRRRGSAAQIAVEASGRLAVPLPDGSTFTLRGRADRIEFGADGAAVVDFKTGQAPSPAQVARGFSPQLTLEAAMLERGAFQHLPDAPLAELL